MITLILLIISIICLVSGILIESKNGAETCGSTVTYVIGGLGTTILGAIFLFGNGQSYYKQISDIENLKKYSEFRQIYQNKSDVLTQQFKNYLAEIYPEFERSIFDSISPDKIDIYLVKYPELQSSKTILALTEQISKLQTDIYNQDIEISETKKDLRVRMRNPILLTEIYPKYEE